MDIQHYAYNWSKICQIKFITMMKNYSESVEIDNNQNWPYISDHPYRILILVVLDQAKVKCD